MSRSGYSDELDSLQLGRWRGVIASATRGVRGQKFFNVAEQLAQEVMYINDEYYTRATPEERWRRVRDWAAKQVRPTSVDGEQA